MNKLLATSVVAVLCHVGTASAAPAWCKDASFEDHYDLKDLSSSDIETVITTLAKATCKPNAEAQASAQQIEAARQAWGKKLQMIDTDWADAVDLANHDGRWDDLKPSVKDLVAMTPMDQYFVIADIAGGSQWDGADYATDMFEPNLTEVGRLAFVDACAAFTPVGFTGEVIYAQCQGDIDALDKAKFATQLRSDTAHPGANKMALRFRLYSWPKRLKEHNDRVQKIWAKDAAYKKLWEAAAKGRAHFAATVGANKELLALATRLDSADRYKSRKQYEGCEAATEAAFTKVVGEKVSKNMFKDLKRDIPSAKFDYGTEKDKEKLTVNVGMTIGPVLSDIPELMFVIGPYLECHRSGDHRSDFLSGMLRYSPGYRGPRMAALTAIMAEKIVLDDMDAKIDYPKIDPPYETHGNGNVATMGGVVGSTRDAEKQIVVEFGAQKLKQQDCVQSHRTNRISRINSDGSLSYELICDKWGMVTYDNTPNPTAVSAFYKKLLKKGVQFSADGDSVVLIWPTKDAKLPSHFLGVELK